MEGHLFAIFARNLNEPGREPIDQPAHRRGNTLPSQPTQNVGSAGASSRSPAEAARPRAILPGPSTGSSWGWKEKMPRLAIAARKRTARLAIKAQARAPEVRYVRLRRHRWCE
jgi:hypothetical protein